MMKVKQLAVSLILASAFAAAPALANTKIGFVNTEKLLREAPLSVARRRSWNANSPRATRRCRSSPSRRGPAGAARQGRRDHVGQRAQDEGARPGNLNRDLQRQGREFREDLNLRRNEELGHIQERARKAIQDIARAEKYDLIVEQGLRRSQERHHRPGDEGPEQQVSQAAEGKSIL
jgi:outer membrane protein